MRMPDPEGDAAMSPPSLVDEGRHGIDAFDVSTVHSEVARPLSRTAADVEDPIVDATRPQHVVAIVLRGSVDAAEQRDVLLGPRPYASQNTSPTTSS